MKAAFYAPLKPPDHPVASGDRAMARGLRTAFAAAGLQTDLAATFQSREPAGDPCAQAALIEKANAMVPGLVARGHQAGWRAWVTYHNYYKAPDLLGPTVARELGIPYLQIESTRARKRLQGPWARYALAAEAASDAAGVIFYLTQRDAEALQTNAVPGQMLIHLKPFLAQDDLPTLSDHTGAVLAVAMMRTRDKLRSYALIAETLDAAGPAGWRLDIAGDGPARPQVEAMMAPFKDRVRFLGALETPALRQVYSQASAFIWPGVNEAFGMVYLEAQAHGLAVIAQDRPGVRDVLAPGDYPDPESGAVGLLARLQSVLDDKLALGQQARNHVARYHLISGASTTLGIGLAKVGLI